MPSETPIDGIEWSLERSHCQRRIAMAESAIAPIASGWPAAWPAGVVHPRVARFCSARIHTLAICLGCVYAMQLILGG